MCEECLNYYLAGMIDGEGSIGILRNGNSNYIIRIIIFSNNHKVLSFLRDKFEGNLYLRSLSCSSLVWTGRAAKVILEQVQDKLIIKQAMGQLALSLPIKGQGYSYTNEEKEQRESMYQQMKLLNQRDSLKDIQISYEVIN